DVRPDHAFPKAQKHDARGSPPQASHFRKDSAAAGISARSALIAFQDSRFLLECPTVECQVYVRFLSSFSQNCKFRGLSVQSSWDGTTLHTCAMRESTSSFPSP